MLRAAIAFFILAFVAALFGAYGVAGVSMDAGRVLLIVFLLCAVVAFVASMVTGKGPRQIP